MRPSPSVHTRLFDGELVILDLAGGEYLALDPVGSLLWSAVLDGQSIGTVAERVAAEYDVTIEQATADLEALLDDLLTRGLLLAEGR